MSGEDNSDSDRRVYSNNEVNAAIRAALTEERIMRLEERFIAHMEKEEETFKEMRLFFKDSRNSLADTHDKLIKYIDSSRVSLRSELRGEMNDNYVSKVEFNNLDIRLNSFRNKIIWTVSGVVTGIGILVYFAKQILPIIATGG